MRVQAPYEIESTYNKRRFIVPVGSDVNIRVVRRPSGEVEIWVETINHGTFVASVFDNMDEARKAGWNI